MSLPSVKTLSEVFGPRAKNARAILEMNRAQLETLPAGAARLAECYHAPATSDLRLTCLDAICDGSHGVEGFQVRDGSWCEYLNTGDAYNATLVRFRGRYRVTSWGDIAERHGG
jgi:hypothetical protein